VPNLIALITPAIQQQQQQHHHQPMQHHCPLSEGKKKISRYQGWLSSQKTTPNKCLHAPEGFPHLTEQGCRQT
jgi:hypothetical protein